jgi:DNA-binding transcriptional LysR family regulator
MDYKQLRNFLAICDEKNFTKAANQRFISQQGLSVSIKALEDELEVPLFYRNPKGIVLTEFGSILEAAAKSYINQHEHIIETIREHREKTKSHISVAIAAGINNVLPYKFFSGFIITYPDISLDIMSFADDTCQKSMLEHKLQLGFSPAPVDSNLFESILCEKSKLTILVGKNHSFAERSSIKLQELKDEKVITLNNHMHPTDLLMELCAEFGVKPGTYLSGHEIDLSGELISTNQFVGFGAGPQDRYPGLVRIDIEDMDFYWEFHLIVNKHTYISDAAKQFITYAKYRLGDKETLP